jgi:hypothetical protein
MTTGPVPAQLLPGAPPDWRPRPGECRLPAPRLSPCLAYLVQKVVRPHWLNKRLGAAVERWPLVRQWYTA